MATAPKPKFVKLTRAELDSVIAAFKQPLLAAAAKVRDEARIAPGKAVYEAAIHEDVRKVLPLLQKHGYTVGITTLYVHSTGGGSGRIELGKVYQNLYRSGHERTIPKELVAASEEVERIYSAKASDIEKAAQSVRSAGLAVKTRFEFGQVWPELVDLMGLKWAVAEIDALPSSLPVVVNLDDASNLVRTLPKAA